MADRPRRLEDLGSDPDGRRFSPSAARNRHDILEALRPVLPSSATVLELASGTGEHAAHFAAAEPGWVWQPTERDPEALESIAAWRATGHCPNLLAPLVLDVERQPWPPGPFDAVVAVNLFHIAPWGTVLSVLDGAARVLTDGGALVVYGAFLRGDRPAAPSNLEFDARLRGRDPELGVRRMEDVAAAADVRGLRLIEAIDVPNNNFLLVIRRAARSAARGRA